MIPSSCHNDDIFRQTQHLECYSWYELHSWFNLSQVPPPLTPFTLFLSVSLSPTLRPRRTGSNNTPLGSRAYAGATCATGRGRTLPCFPRDIKVWHMCRIVRERERETERSESYFLSLSCGLINVSRICSICSSRGYWEIGTESQIAEIQQRPNTENRSIHSQGQMKWAIQISGPNEVASMKDEEMQVRPNIMLPVWD